MGKYQRPPAPVVYCTLKRRFTTEALVQMRFVPDGSRMVKRGGCRSDLAVATSLDGNWWRVTPLVRHWR
jgi:hypothetical protein